jgi:hypothetical protein
LIATVLLLLNYDAYQVLEGYLPPMSWFGICKTYHKRRHKKLKDGVKTAVDGKDPDAGKLRREFLATYPSNPDWILPTAFGNALRSFETYAYDVYRADSVVLWPRLAAVVPKSFMALVDNARCQVDFLVSLCVLGWVIAAIAVAELASQVLGSQPPKLPLDASRLSAEFGCALFASWIFYRWAVHALGGWGEAVKSVSDCYLPALAAQLGYVLPDQEAERRLFWPNVVQRFIYRRGFPKGFNPIVPTALGPTTVEPKTAGFSIRSSIGRGCLRIVLSLGRKW